MNSLEVESNEIIADILREVFARIKDTTRYIMLTTPPHFTDDQKQAFSKTAKDAGFEMVKLVDEQQAMAEGICRRSNSEDNFILVNYSNPTTIASLFYGKTEIKRKSIDIEGIENYKKTEFDNANANTSVPLNNISLIKYILGNLLIIYRFHVCPIS